MPTKPTKLFDVRKGDTLVDTDFTVYSDADLIVYKDSASRNMVVDAFADIGSYPATMPDPANPNGTIPNPKSKRQFFFTELQAIIAARVDQSRQKQAHAAIVVNNTDLP